MTAHELAKLLLDGPDLTLYLEGEDIDGYPVIPLGVDGVEPMNLWQVYAGDWVDLDEGFREPKQEQRAVRTRPVLVIR